MTKILAPCGSSCRDSLNQKLLAQAILRRAKAVRGVGAALTATVVNVERSGRVGVAA
jgi:hypothetical protein